MCGITGFSGSDRGVIEAMTARLSHRGNDQHGIYVDEEVSLGHQRLSIIDLSANGKQPLTNEDGSLWLTFNGEIYNFQKLRRDLLAQGHIFKSSSDSEVIVHAYEEWGENCVQQFQGMFAFAIWDRNKKTIFVARDRVGIKPLYYYHKGKTFVFASEIKAVLEHPNVERQLNLQSLFDCVGYEFVPGPATMFENIYKLEPGHSLTWRDGQVTVRRYWDLEYRPGHQDRAWYEEKIVELLDQTVKSHLVSDVPLGIFLSGGIDSSSLLAMMRRHTNGLIRSFSIGYEQKSYSEYEYAKKVADHFGTVHTEIMLPPISPEIIEKSVYHFDEPTTDFSNIPYMILCQEARKHVTVVLGGDGGDEMFAGYDRFRASKLNRLYSMLPCALREKLIYPLTQKLPDQPEKKGPINMFRRFAEGSHLDPAGAHIRWQYFLGQDQRQLFNQDFLRKINPSPFRPVERFGNRGRFPTELDKELYLDLKTVMVDSVLMKVDKMSMASAMEIRVPFLDHRFVEFCATIPSHIKLKGLETKSVFKSAMNKHLPEGIAYRKKQGFSFPIKHWLRQELKDYSESVLNDSELMREHFDLGFINLLMAQHQSRTHNHSHILWSLVNVALWYDMFVGKSAASYEAVPGATLAAV